MKRTHTSSAERDPRRFRHPTARVLVFAKAPVPGAVKTRLARKYGARGAARLYRQLLDATLEKCTRAALCPVELWCAPDAGHAFFHRCRARHGSALRNQRGADLGQRMHHALRCALRAHDFALVIGGDCAALTAADLHAALDALRAGQDAVLGPAEDGGYVLIGLRRPCAALFRDMPWGGDAVLEKTRKRLARAGMRWLELPTRWDVDRPRDVRRLRNPAAT